MPAIIPVPALNDNYIWLISDGARTACIDPGEAGPVLACLHRQGLRLEQIWITHHHHDHTGGIAGLKRAFPRCTVYGNDDIAAADVLVGEGSLLHFGAHTVRVWAVPGHTGKHLAYLADLGGRTHVFCGDTLFSAGCGRIFTGTAAQLAHSFRRFDTLPPDTLFYPAHEYTAANLKFAAHIEPDNPYIIQAGQAASLPSLPVSLAHERRINPFLRVKLLRERAESLCGLSLPDDTAVFAALRELKDGFS
ncbi:MAG: hydroxyacylglutathione hydrolase [Neisseria sp.]|nr:hydroxyacylglutathione hydrolase [Neisseria sp.]